MMENQIRWLNLKLSELPNPSSLNRIFPYLGGFEVNSSPTHLGNRFVINLSDVSDQKRQLQAWPALEKIIRQKVKPGAYALGRQSKQHTA